MMWQDMVFLIGSMTSVTFLYPTLRNKASQVPRATSVPSMLIGGAYAFTFFTLGMTFSAVGAFAACTMWSLIAAFRAPDSSSPLDSSRLPTDNRVVNRLETLFRRRGPRNVSGRSTDSTEKALDQSAGGEPGNAGFENDLDVAANSD